MCSPRHCFKMMIFSCHYSTLLRSQVWILEWLVCWRSPESHLYSPPPSICLVRDIQRYWIDHLRGCLDRFKIIRFFFFLINTCHFLVKRHTVGFTRLFLRDFSYKRVKTSGWDFILGHLGKHGGLYSDEIFLSSSNQTAIRKMLTSKWVPDFGRGFLWSKHPLKCDESHATICI